MDPEYEKELTRDLKAKVEDYKQQIANKTEIMKFEVQEKLREYEAERVRRFVENLKEELSYLDKDFQQFKEMLEADFAKEKIRLQKKSEDEISALRQLTLEQLQEKKKVFDDEQLDKILTLKLKVNRIKEFDEHEALDVKDKLTHMEDGISKSQRALKAKVKFIVVSISLIMVGISVMNLVKSSLCQRR